MKHFATAILAFGIMLAALPPARADTTCPPNPPIGSTVNGTLVVPSNMTCRLLSVTVTGNVQVGTGATLLVGGTTVDGNVQADQCVGVFLGPGGLQVGGNVRIENCTAFSADAEANPPEHVNIGGNLACNGNGRCLITGVSVRGNVQVNGNGSVDLNDPVHLISNTFGGNVQVNDNTEATIFIGSNTIDGNLSCQGNTSAPTDGGSPNTVAGKKQGQCAGL